MPCIPAIKYGLSGPQREERLAKKFCGWQDLIGLTRSQMLLDRADNLTNPSTQTQELANELVRQIDAEGAVCSYVTTMSCVPGPITNTDTQSRAPDSATYYSQVGGDFGAFLGTTVPTVDPGEWFICLFVDGDGMFINSFTMTLYINCTGSTVTGGGGSPSGALTASNIVTTLGMSTLTVSGTVSVDVNFINPGNMDLTLSNLIDLSGGPGGAVYGAATAENFGLYQEINCRRLCTLVGTCTGTTLGDIGDGSVNFDENPEEFLCCLRDHFARLQSFLERVVAAKNCESAC